MKDATPDARDAPDAETSHLLDSGVDLHAEGQLAEPDLTAKAAGGFLWALVGFAALQLGGFGTYAVAGNTLGTADLGIVGKLLTIVFWMDVLLDLGLGASIIHDQEHGITKRVRVAFTVNAGLAVVVSGGLLLAAPAIAGFFNIEEKVGLVRLLALLALVKGLNQVPESMLRRDLRFKQRSAVDVTRSLCRFAFAATLLAAGWGPTAMVVSVLVAECLGVVLTWLLARFRPSIAFDRVEASGMLRYGLAVFGSRLLGMLWLNGDYLVVGSRLSNAAYGDYFTAFRLPELVLGSVYNIFSNVAFPTYSAAREVGPDKLRQASLRSLRMLCLFGFPVGVGMALVARDFITTVFSKHPGAIRPMEVLSVAGGFVAIGFASGDLYNAIGKPRLGLYFNLLGTPILIGGFLIAVPYGITAIAMVHLVVMVPYSAFRIEVANRLIGTTWAASLAALRPAAATVAGIVAAALPIRLLAGAGFGTGVAIVAAGAVGGALGLALGDRSTFGEMRDLARKALGR